MSQVCIKQCNTWLRPWELAPWIGCELPLQGRESRRQPRGWHTVHLQARATKHAPFSVQNPSFSAQNPSIFQAHESLTFCERAPKLKLGLSLRCAVQLGGGIIWSGRPKRSTISNAKYNIWNTNSIIFNANFMIFSPKVIPCRCQTSQPQALFWIQNSSLLMQNSSILNAKFIDFECKRSLYGVDICHGISEFFLGRPKDRRLQNTWIPRSLHHFQHRIHEFQPRIQPIFIIFIIFSMEYSLTRHTARYLFRSRCSRVVIDVLSN